MDNISPSRQKIIDLAMQELGIKESPSGSNLTKFGEWYGENGVSWCAIFVSWVYFFAGYPLGTIDTAKGYASCQDGLNHFKAAGQLTDNPQPGDIVFYDFIGSGVAHHTGIYFGPDVLPDHFWAIEGNTSIGNNSNGGEVMKRLRSKSSVMGFASPGILS